MYNNLMMDALPYIADMEVALWKRLKKYLAANQKTFTFLLTLMCGNYNVYSNRMLNK